MMFFHTGLNEHVLLEALHTSTAGDVAGACVVIFALAMLYEALKMFKEHLHRRNRTCPKIDPIITKSNGTTAHPSDEKETVPKRSHMLSGSHFMQTTLHVLQVFLSYCLMLVFMTYNVWFGIAVILGAATGYFLFGWRRSVVVDINEHCN